MKTKTVFFLFMTVIACTLVSASVPVLAETTQCTRINAIPYTISTPGIYCLTHNYSTSITSGSAIAINADDVVLDLNGFKIEGQRLSPTDPYNPYGIYAYQRKNITVKNGTVQSFAVGAFLDDTPYSSEPYYSARGYIVEDMRAFKNSEAGIIVRGIGNTVRNNYVDGAGLTGKGIEVNGYNIMISNNEVTDISIGIMVADPSGTVILDNNKIGNPTMKTDSTYGVYFWAGSKDTIAVNNRISTMTYGIRYDSNPSSAATGKYRDNMTVSVTSPYAGGGIDAGNNN